MKRVRKLAAALLLAFAAGGAEAACTVSAQSVIFGNYDVFSGQPLDGIGNIAITCDIATPYTLSLSTGSSGSFALRALANAGYRLNYNLFVDAAHATVWGDGSGGSAIASAGGSASTGNHTVYGRIPAGQNATVGSYSDSVTVTVSY